MEESSKSPSPKTFRQGVAGKWQIPLFAMSLVGFALTMIFLRPHAPEPDYQGMIDQLQILTQQKRPAAFYTRAEAVRQIMLRDNKRDYQADVRRLAAEFRYNELMRRGAMGLEPDVQKVAPRYYRTVIDDYLVAFSANRPDPNSTQAAVPYDHIALAYWGLDQPHYAIRAIDKAVEVDQHTTARGQMKVKMLLASRPEGYVQVVFDELDRVDPNDLQGRAWAFMKRIELLIDQGDEKQALDMVIAQGDTFEGTPHADMLTLLQCRALRFSGDLDQADIKLRDLLSRIQGYGDLYAMTLLELADINYQQSRDMQARRFYGMIESSQNNTDWGVAALLGLARCEAMGRQFERSRHYFERTIARLERRGKNPVVSKDDVRNSLAALADELTLTRHYREAMEFALLENRVAPEDDQDSAYRLARLYGYWAGEISEQIVANSKRSGLSAPDSGGKVDEQERREWERQQQRLAAECYQKAAGQYTKVASLIQNDDKLYGDCLYQAARGYDLAGDTAGSIQAWQRFVSERIMDPRWPGALFFLGQAHQAMGDYDEAITYYRQLRASDPRLPVSFDAAVLLAQCYLWNDPNDGEQRVENLLLSVLHDPAITPGAVHFRKATFELGKLYYSTGRYRRAIGVLITAIERYQNVEGLGRAIYFVADSYRRSALSLEERLTELKSRPADSLSYERLFKLQNSYYELARSYFEQAIVTYDGRWGVDPDARKVDELYYRNCWLYWADCLFDLELYHEAALRYELAASRYQLTPTALSAFVQIVNCQMELGQADQARSANERARLQLAQMEEGDLMSSANGFDRQQWSDWFDWMAQAGLW